MLKLGEKIINPARSKPNYTGRTVYHHYTHLHQFIASRLAPKVPIRKIIKFILLLIKLPDDEPKQGPTNACKDSADSIVPHE
jgi:hypothetical protein